MKRVVLSAFVVFAISACHSSCTEDTGAQPVVNTEEAGPVLGAQHATPNLRPMMRPVMPLRAIQSTASAAPATADP